MLHQGDFCFAMALFKIFAKIIPRLVCNADGSFDEEKKGSGTDIFKGRVIEWIKEKWKSVKGTGRRDLCTLIELIPQCQDCFSVAEYNDYFLNEMISILKSGNKEAKKLASHSFCVLFLKNYFQQSRNEAIAKVLDMSKSMTCFERLAVLNFFEASVAHFSKKFIYEQGIMKTYLSMGEDKVANVRIRFASIAGRMSQAITQEESRTQLLFLLNLLQNDMDKDVRKLSKEACQSIKQKPSVTDPKLAEDDDLAKEKREQDLLKREKEVRTIPQHQIGRRNKETAGRRTKKGGKEIRTQPGRAEKGKSIYEDSTGSDQKKAEEEEFRKNLKGHLQLDAFLF